MALGFLRKLAAKLMGAAPSAKEGAPSKRPAPREPAKSPSGTRRGDRRRGDAAKPPAPGDVPPRSRSRGRRGRGRRAGDPSAQRPQTAAGADAAQTLSSEKAASPAGRLSPRPTATARPSGRGGDRRRERGGRASGGPRVSTGERPGGVVSQERLAQLREEHLNWDPASYTVEPVEGKKRFHDFNLPGELMHAIADLGFRYCSPIQALSLDAALEGRNVAGRAQTGTGKTAAYLVAILTRYLRSPEKRPEKGGVPRALVIAPTRELVVQIAKDAEALGKYCGLRCLAVYGGMDYDRQRDEVLDAPVDLLVATPGRLLDFTRGHVVDLGHVDTLVIDEADRMLDMGFIPDVRSIMHRLPEKDKRTTMLYSATLNEDIMKLASQWMAEPVRCEVEGETVNTKAIKQIVYVVTANEKFTILFNHILQYPDSRMIIFCNRRHTTEDVARGLSARGVKCEVLSGDVNQNQRLRILEDFRAGKVRIVVATDVAGRGLHVDDIGFVINFDFPYEPEDYVHRIGRTGRAGATGVAISFADEDESFIIPDIEKFIGEELKCTMLQPDDPLLAKIPDRNGGRRGRRDDRGPARRGRRPRWDDGSLPDETPAEVPAAPEAAPAAEAVSEPVAAPAENIPAPENKSVEEAPAPTDPVAAEPAPAAPETASDAQPDVPAPEPPKKRTPFVRLFNEPQPGEEAKEEARDPQEGGQGRKAPLPPLCKPVYDKPWMVHDGETFRRGIPRQHQTVRKRVFDEEWKPGGETKPGPETSEGKADE